jgi:hypothetical protein
MPPARDRRLRQRALPRFPWRRTLRANLPDVAAAQGYGSLSLHAGRGNSIRLTMCEYDSRARGEVLPYPAGRCALASEVS